MSYGNKSRVEVTIQPDNSYSYDKVTFANDTLFVSARRYVELYRDIGFSDDVNVLIKQFSDKDYDTVCFDIR